MDGWTQVKPYAVDIHSGDLGWHLRFPDERLDGAVLCWDDGGAPVAVGLRDAGMLQLAVAPGWSGSGALADAVADLVTPTDSGTDHVEAASESALRALLLDRGWRSDPHPWVLLHKALGREDAAVEDPGTRPLAGPADVEARVAVQRSAFAPGSTFTPELWTRMAEGPSYDARFELVTWTPDGRPAAAATGWFAGPGRCAILEPVGTHADHRRQGYGRRVNLAVMAALARAGASAVRVHTPASNTAAVAAYEACGLRQADWTTAVTRAG